MRSVPVVPGVVGIHFSIIAKMDVCNGITLQDGGICLHVNIGQLPVVEEQVRRNVQGKGSVPCMEDATGLGSFDVHFVLNETEQGTVLTVEADEEWINSEDRVFPVKIDPTLVVYSGSALEDIYSAYTMEAAPNDTTLGRQWLYVGAQPYSTTNDGRYRIYMHFQNMPTVPSGSEVVDAQLSLYKTAYVQRYCEQFPIGAYEVTTSLPSSYSSYYDWFSKMTWYRDQPAYDTTNAIDYAFGKAGSEYVP